MKALIVLVTIIGLAAVIGAVVVGSRSFEGIVTEHPYEHGLSWDKAQQAKRVLGWEVGIREKEFSVGKKTLTLTVLDKTGKPLEEASVSVTVSRPSTAAYDRTYMCERMEEGFCRAVVDLPLYGHWDLKIRVVKGQDDMAYEKEIFAER
jgi:nitrogen fixation protein FixH